ncbi:hypothetical protein [Prosthecodimorpha staleyi]|uniref:Uncharacterized protein n=1 Tax=Prosthecodimorpha staleyi TaxID=2840188 RepID=A0A947GC16_9HYPH|nr:hypothetical protein [Prosthecodimorpha staleyi]MBT9290883.1 hypothetical protein [Prosthecodimorpha staleyi]
MRQEKPETGGGITPSVTASIGEAEAALRRNVDDLAEAARTLGNAGIAEFQDLAASLDVIGRRLALSDPIHPDGRAFRVRLAAHLDTLRENLDDLLAEMASVAREQGSKAK